MSRWPLVRCVNRIGGVLLLSVAVTACQADGPPPASAGTSVPAMATAARGFLESLSDEQREVAAFSMTADSARASWSNLPAMFVRRGGVRLGDMDDEQRRALHDLLRASTSSQGYQKLAGIIRLDGLLHEEASGAVQRGERRLSPELVDSWDSRNYWVSVFGEPGRSDTWGWQLSGHHLAANFTVVDARLSFTPLFLGAEPAEVQEGLEAGWRVLSHEAERGFELLRALYPAQRAQAVLGDSIPADILTGPGRKGSLESYSGLSADQMDEAQLMLLWALIREFVSNVDFDAGQAQLSRIQADGLHMLYFAWIGPTSDVDERYYYRVHGPSVLIEYVVQEGVGGSAANHVHSIVRDPQNDYGEDWLGRHYQEHHFRIR